VNPLLPITFHILATLGKPLMSKGTPSGFVETYGAKVIEY